ncbi:MAG: SDR family NAD(P)-dependent oxidoreductase [Clostridia bacterium]|nr:SDR family NAD(P)-dependent oxidoreductase [Clostridia bacterium]
MNINNWIKRNCGSLKGKTVAITGSTGGLGNELCFYFARLGANLVLVDRNREKSENFARTLKDKYSVRVTLITADLEDRYSVTIATELIKKEKPDIFIHNAGAYSIPRHKTKQGLDNVFAINFASPYYMIKELIPTLRETKGRVIAVSSIAHNYSKSDPDDIDFSNRTAASKVYGNAKRYLMCALWELFKNETGVKLAIAHPGITPTGITAHYPAWIYAIIKYPMKVIFMRPKVAALSVLKGVFEETGYMEWIGPWLFDIWGRPIKKKLCTVSETESKRIFETAEQIVG